MLSQALIILTHLENTIYVSTTHNENASCSFAPPKYLQHLLVTPIIVFWLQSNRNNCEKSTIILCNAQPLTETDSLCYHGMKIRYIHLKLCNLQINYIIFFNIINLLYNKVCPSSTQRQKHPSEGGNGVTRLWIQNSQPVPSGFGGASEMLPKGFLGEKGLHVGVTW